ncbi:hypothetical protein SSSV7_gp15 [Sulfolobus spindle-shaped virus 7]|uniref:Uncharacterized protein n=1 Tax=Sulfolobus spindle-shaped virus 7 TaxID=693628 RepID=D1GF66_9VIRU|nr:hypothetical protein SSSV7_gp15 [Sulfolobus spindle-shaped virus 7]ACZ35768.1 hypothetical protein [Sulfolobus spindle-shaped virus 7]
MEGYPEKTEYNRGGGRGEVENQEQLTLIIRTHGFTAKKHINWDDLNYVAITPVGSVVVFRDRTDWTFYAVYSPMRGRYHVHIPYSNYIHVLDERARKVLEEVNECLHFAQCYIDNGMIYSVNRMRIRDFIPFGMGEHTSNTDFASVKFSKIKMG